LETRYGRELQVVNEQFPFEPFKCKRPVLRITFAECVELLKEKGVIVPPLEDFDTETEKKIGAIIKEKFNTDFYFIYRYPANARPFYTMPCKDDPNYTNSYDFFMRGEEITSGGQRVHDPDFLKKRIESFGIDPATLQSYIDSFKYGAPPHGGCGIGLERVVMLYCNLRNIRNSSMFPRDPKRLLP
jgi:aspartyl-tRNA synthetase